MKVYGTEHWEITDRVTDERGIINIDLYPENTHKKNPREVSITLDLKDAEDFARALLDRIFRARQAQGGATIYVDVQTGAFGDATGIRYVNENGSELVEASDSEVIEYGEGRGW